MSAKSFSALDLYFTKICFDIGNHWLFKAAEFQSWADQLKISGTTLLQYFWIGCTRNIKSNMQNCSMVSGAHMQIIIKYQCILYILLTPNMIFSNLDTSSCSCVSLNKHLLYSVFLNYTGGVVFCTCFQVKYCRLTNQNIF